MDTLFIPNEQDFRRWIKEAVKECLENEAVKNTPSDLRGEEPLLTRKEIAGIFRISLVTLHDWMKRGLPFHKQGGRVYFLRSEVMEYVKQKRNVNVKRQEYGYPED
ncbi:helix-turn-helix domain-containing protein [Chitinophaga sp.]|uniref:helix-turn-helix domain-containing protein n=1 Tax=Chitinophaga sp. TaxID=1869181 RepID=UPI002C80A2C2|nr:helix-turn-helix domain-containing protein [Chitinophaga sp.]HWV64763.1 helix-turn-helix domain-containing protein [Chitinophaga sp.]